MEPVLGEWEAPPTVTLPLIFPAEIHDWVNPPTDDSLPTLAPEPLAQRQFRLDQEDLLQNGTRIFTYREIEG